jgi:hypothetical protein
MLVCDRTAELHYADPETGWAGFSTSQILHQIEPMPYGTNGAMLRGTAIHNAVACLWLGLPVERPPLFDDCADLFEGYMIAARNFLRDRVGQVLMVEDKLKHKTLRYATQIDLLATLRGPTDETLTLIDVKSGQPSKRYRLQMHLQKPLEGIDRAAKMLLLYLRPDGTYQEVPVAWSKTDWAVVEATVIAMWNQHCWRKGA